MLAEGFRPFPVGKHGCTVVSWSRKSVPQLSSTHQGVVLLLGWELELLLFIFYLFSLREPELVLLFIFLTHCKIANGTYNVTLNDDINLDVSFVMVTKT